MKELFQELISCKGRFNRTRFWVYTICVKVIFLILAPVLIILLGEDLGIIISALLLIPGTYLIACIAIKRAHDLDKSGHFVWLIFIPIVNIYPSILLAFFKGTIGPNQYGSDPLLTP